MMEKKETGEKEKSLSVDNNDLEKKEDEAQNMSCCDFLERKEGVVSDTEAVVNTVYKVMTDEYMYRNENGRNPLPHRHPRPTYADDLSDRSYRPLSPVIHGTYSTNSPDLMEKTETLNDSSS